MTNEEILKKAIEKATKNGWKIAYDQIDVSSIKTPVKEVVQIVGWYKSRDGNMKADHLHLNYIIFEHSFAKAFWGEDIDATTGVEWKYNLQQMVLEEDPIKYLEQFI